MSIKSKENKFAFFENLKITKKILLVTILTVISLVISSNILIAITIKRIVYDRTIDDMKSKTMIAENIIFSATDHIPNIAKELSTDEIILDYMLELNNDLNKLNLVKRILTNCNIDFMILADENDIIFQDFYNGEVKTKIASFTNLLTNIKKHTLELKDINFSEKGNSKNSALVYQHNKIYYLASHPIISNDSIIGTINLGKIMDLDELNILLKPMSICIVDIISDYELSTNNMIKQQLFNDDYLYYEKNDISTIYLFKNDIFNDENFCFIIKNNSIIMQETRKILFFSLMIITIIIFLPLIILYFALQKIIVYPLEKLTNEIEEVIAGKKSNIDNSFLKGVEFSYLGDSIYNMLLGINLNTKSIEITNNSLNVYLQALNATSDEIIIIDNDYVIEFTNPSAKKNMVFSDSQNNKKNIISYVAPNNKEFFKQVMNYVKEGNSWSGKLEFKNKRKMSIIFEVSISPILSSYDVFERYIIIKRNDGDLNIASKIKHVSYHDSLTGLPNRKYFFDSLNRLIKRLSKTKQCVTIFWIDIDKFKYINDEFGHMIGDKVLKSVSVRLANSIPDNIFISRIGGDEFGFIVPELSSENKKIMFANKILKIIERPFEVDDKIVSITASIGSSTYPADSIDLDTLVKNVDEAMYNAKFLGGNQYCIFSKDIHEILMKRLSLENMLRNAIADDCKEFSMCFQAKMDILTGYIIGFEALIRWNSKKGLIFPDQFVSIAEETGLILPLSKWILYESCRYNKELIDLGYNTFISVNIPTQVLLHESFIDVIKDVLNLTHMESKYLDIEITESTLMNDVEKINSIFYQLKDMGITVSVDDFGTGYSSLSYLKKFYVNRIKIDRSFIMEITNNEEDLALVKAIIAMAKSLRIVVTAEGVETKKQLEILKELSCEEAQGYLISKPISFPDTKTFLHDWYSKQ